MNLEALFADDGADLEPQAPADGEDTAGRDDEEEEDDGESSEESDGFAKAGDEEDELGAEDGTAPESGKVAEAAPSGSGGSGWTDDTPIAVAGSRHRG